MKSNKLLFPFAMLVKDIVSVVPEAVEVLFVVVSTEDITEPVPIVLSPTLIVTVAPLPEKPPKAALTFVKFTELASVSVKVIVLDGFTA